MIAGNKNEGAGRAFRSLYCRGWLGLLVRGFLSSLVEGIFELFFGGWGVEAFIIDFAF